MKTLHSFQFIARYSCPLLAALLLSTSSASAQTPPVSPDEILRKPLVDFTPASARDNAPGSGTARLRLFGMPTGFLRDPLGIDSDDPVPENDGRTAMDDELPGFLVAMGNYNPFFDMRRPEDPRGPGYYKFHSQMQVLDMGRTNVSLTLAALAPAGLETGGVANGPTVLTPAVAWFYDLGAGRALQGYVGQNYYANSRWSDSLGSRIHCGVAMQHPVPGLCPDGEQGLFFFVQALGCYRCEDRPDGRTADGRTTVWEVIPGLQWRLSDNCWFSVGASRSGMFTWFWQF